MTLASQPELCSVASASISAARAQAAAERQAENIDQ